MSDQYHILFNGETKGPYSKSQLKSMWDNGLITSNTHYWTDGMVAWLLVASLFESDKTTDRSRLKERALSTPRITHKREHFGLTHVTQYTWDDPDKPLSALSAQKKKPPLFQLAYIPIIVVLFIGCMTWVFTLNHSNFTFPGSTPNGMNNTNRVFPAGSYKFVNATYITLNPDGTFEVKSNDTPLWVCHGSWSFSGDTLNMQARVDKTNYEWMPYIFYKEAKLVSNGKEVVVWDCMFKTYEWKKLD